RTRRLQLGHLLDLDDADAARSVDADAGVITIIRNGNAALDGGLQNRLAFLDGNLAAIDGQRDSVHRYQEYIEWGAGCAGTAGGRGRGRYFVNSASVPSSLLISTPCSAPASGTRRSVTCSVTAITTSVFFLSAYCSVSVTGTSKT